MNKLLIHYLLIALKNVWKYRVSAAISILGLAFALVCLVPILYWMDHELSYDSAYPGSKFIYRVYSAEKSTGKINTGASKAIQASVCQENPAIEASTLLFITPENCRTDRIPYVQVNMLYTDSTFLNVFPQEIICGDRIPLRAINNIVLTESMATHLFGEPTEAIGKHLQTLMAPKWAPYVVTAVVKDPGKHTNLPFDAIIHHDMIDGLNRGSAEMQWQYFMTDCYVRLHPDTDPEAFADRIRDLPERVGVNKDLELRAMPIQDIRHHLKGDAPFTLDFIGLFVASGILLLLAALFNFLNSYMDLFRQRAREWRLRLVNGATRGQLITQVAVELACAVVAALLVALVFIVQMRPLFAGWLDIDMDYVRILTFFAWMGLLALALILLIGLPLFAHINRQMTSTLAENTSARSPLSRRMAVALQLMVSIIFIVAATVVMLQLRYLGNKDVGFDREDLLLVDGFVDVRGNVESALIQELQRNPSIVGLTDTDFKPQHEMNAVAIIKNVEWEGKPQGEEIPIYFHASDYRFGDTFGLRYLSGGWWLEGEQQRIVINESMARLMDMENPVGQVIRMPDLRDYSQMAEYVIAGVVNDIHTLSFRHPIHPTAFIDAGGFVNKLYVRTAPGQSEVVADQIRTLLPKISPTLADAQVTPVGALYDALNQSETIGLRIFSFLALACLLIALFGIYAAANAATKRRRREIAIRKVVGAGTGSILLLFIREYARLIAIASLIAFPIAYLIMVDWLSGYAYRIGIAIWWLVAILAGIAALVLLTIWRQVVKAANENPAEVIKCE